MKPFILSFDLGTTYFKAALFDEAGVLTALARQSTPIVSPHEGWREIPLDAFHATIARLIADLRGQSASAVDAIKAISFATQANSFVLLDDAGSAMTPLILWNDRRAEMEPAPEIARISAQPGTLERTGVPSLSGGFMVGKLAWLNRHQPGLVQKARQIRLISDYLTLWFTGQSVTEAGVAGLTGVLDIHDLTWRAGALQVVDVKPGQLAKPVRAGTAVGTVLPAVARELGLPSDVLFVTGCLDQYAGPIGVGNVSAGSLTETTGTVLATVALTDRFDANLGSAVFQGPAWKPGFYWRMCFGDVSAGLFEAYARSKMDEPDFNLLVSEAAAVPDETAARMNVQMSLSKMLPVFDAGYSPSRGAEVRGILNAVADALADQVAMLYPHERPTQITSAGGAARSDFWLQLKSNLLRMPFTALNCPEPTALGAANLAMSALTRQPIEQIARDRARVRVTIQPR